MKVRIAALLAALLATPTVAQAPVAPAAPAAPAVPAVYGAPIGLDLALELIRDGRQVSRQMGVPIAMAIVEPSGELVAFARMDGVPYATINIAQQKARTAARFRLPTAEFERRVQDGRIVLLSSDEVMAVGGGVPIVVDGKAIGALGISGGTAAQDTAIANQILAGS